MDKQTINQRVETGDRYLLNSEYLEAFKEYEESLIYLQLLATEGKKSKSIGNIAGWAAGILTGGIGLEDLFIIPAVSKGVSSFLGSDDSYINSISNLILLKQIDCLLHSEQLVENTNKNIVIQKFALLYSTVNISNDIFNRTISLYLSNLGSADVYDNNEAILASYHYLMDKIDLIDYQTKDYSYLLYSYLLKTNDNSELFIKLKAMHDNSSSHSESDDSKNYSTENKHKDRSYYYSVLGVTESASNEEIKKAYRNLVSKYHPDKFASLSEEFQEIAERKTKEIIEAYNKLTKGS